MRKTLLAIAAAAVLATTAAKAGGTKAECQSIITANGFLSHGSIICNPAWLDRLSSLDFAAGASECPVHNQPEGRRLLKLGFDKFDALIAKLGHDAACVELDGKISAQDKRVKADPERLAEAIMFEKNVAKSNALEYCASNPDARETGRDDESALSVRACALRILQTTHDRH